MRLRTLLYAVIAILVCGAAFAQQTGAISGKVTSDGQPLPGVTVEARSNVLPQPRVTTTDTNGQFSLPALVPGAYTLNFSLSGMQNVTRRAEVQLSQSTHVDVTMGVQGVSESITVTAEASLVDKTSTQIESGLTQKEIEALPVLQNYGDLQKLIPGVMYSQDTFRGPSAGASGQDNVYLFDGVNITMPLFGILNTQPNTHDIAQVSVIKGGAKAVDFNRAGGFLIDSVSKSGTNKFSGELGYQLRDHNFVADQVGTQNLTYAQDRSWGTANIGGPILADRLFFYGSYYRPEFKRSNQANVYGELPGYTLKTNEEFLKLTFSPTQALLINGSYRNNHTEETSGAFGAFQARTTGTGSDTKLQLGTLETSWITSPRSFATVKFTNFRNPGFGKADFVANAAVSTALGTQLDINNLGNIGRLIVPTLTPGNTAQNAFVQPFINQYGYVCPQNPGSTGLTCTAGQRTGGGTVGFGLFSRDDDSFFRKGGQVGYNYTLGGHVTHDLHVGYQRYNDSEDRFQTSNGWGSITIPAGIGSAGTCPASACGTATPAFFVAQFSQQTTGKVPVIHSEFHSQNVELNDTIRWNNWSFNAGVLASNDTLYGQGLKKADNVAGYVASPGTKYKMHSFSFSDMIQPRLGATWAYNGSDTVWTSYAKYYPAANSDARAASWDRNLVAQINAYFDTTGKLIGVQPNASSSGKWWQDGIKPPHIDEYMVGTARQLTPRWSARLYGRYRHGTDYMEDTNNTARSDFNAPAGIPRDPYVPNLGNTATPGTIRNAIGSGSSYVIANLDGAFTKYYEATLEQEWNGDKLVVNGSYTWSHYYGNFDQDNSSFSSANDAAIFIGSSNIGDGAGRQLWDFKYGDLRGDRRNVVKGRATYFFPWHGRVGAFGVYQSGQPYQLESVLPYRPLTGSTSDTARYAEAAGSRRSPSYYDVDLNYTQNFPLPRGLNVQLAFDVFNLTDNQEGYNFETRIGTLGLKQIANTQNPYKGATVAIPDSISDATLKTQLGLKPADPFNRADYAVAAPYANTHYAPRRYQIALRLQF
ncbi:MAG TPA: carboxypeptidase regulatory-like domain-containing protein [Thermoanaerobaculia bacterium]|nr:carboxypeptidase regulatory-like domain-containing protein [Thermoanaerobaculia bacterium]